MANYNKSVNFAVKDTLQAGDPQKIVSGAEIDTEFNNISSSSTTKIDKVSSATTGNVPQFTATGTIEDSGKNPASLGSPAGTISAFAGTSEPDGWFFCNGQELNRSTNSALFNTIGTTFGEGNGSTTFTLPDLRGEFIRGFDDGKGVDSGRSFGSSQSDEFESHSHGTGQTGSNTQQSNALNDTFGIIIVEGNGGQSTSTEGGVETRPRNVALNYIIKA